ncbi:MAG: VOC family protein [Cyanobacteria bacterium J06659_2]
MSNTEVGPVVWHDLLSNDVTKAKRFYAELLGWEYQIEHAADFVWKPGEADYPLILSNGEAHGGFVDSGQDMPSHWVAYVAVEDVDAVAVRAEVLGATVVREPFDTPGVGRSAVIQDAQGAITCPHVPTHNFPPPRGTFVWDELITEDVEQAKIFYGKLFDWPVNTVARGPMGSDATFKCADNTDAVGAITRSLGGSAVWLTYLATRDVNSTVTQAKTLGAIVYIEATDVPKVGQFAVLADPTGAVFGLLAPHES